MSKAKNSAMIGAYQPQHAAFPLDVTLKQFENKEFKTSSSRKRFHLVNQTLLTLIQQAPAESFLLPAVIQYIAAINAKGLLNDPYHLSIFEFWLNHFSDVSQEENYRVRAKIAGKYIPRDDYQALFPIGMDKTFAGTHFVAAHLSPDVDTMIASFWGWMDAFAARVGNAQHIWSLPGGPPISPVTQSFQSLIGNSIFKDVAHTSGMLTLRALDLVTQKGFVKAKGTASISSLDLKGDNAVILVDDEGNYLGDWHSSDVDAVRKIIIRFKSCLRWFENTLHVRLILLLAKEKLHVKDLIPFLKDIFDTPVSSCEPAKEFDPQQRTHLHDFFQKVLGLKKGLDGTFGELCDALATLSVPDLKNFKSELESLGSSDIFNSSGYMVDDHSVIFKRLEKIIHQLDNVVHTVRDYAEQLDVSMKIKTVVLGMFPEYVYLRSDVEDIRIKMKKQDYLTVVLSEDHNKLFPIGVVWANDVNKPVLGTATFRDFCNQEEVKMAPYLTPISVVDHHKTSLKTSSAPMALIGDAQSCNVLVAEQAFEINDRYSTEGIALDAMDKKLAELLKEPKTAASLRLQQRLLKLHLAAEVRHDHFIHPDREFTEYLSFVHAILDDTDLLTKVSKRDIECIVQLLNRLKSLMAKEAVETISLDGIARDKSFSKNAAQRILQNPDMFSIYHHIYNLREQEIESYFGMKSNEQTNNLFLDTKTQNGCCRVGQTKIFSTNFPTYLKKKAALMEHWLKNAQAVHQEHPEIDLFIHMISTIPSAKEVHEDKVGNYAHQDEMWFWVPPTLKAYDHLSSFLTAFQASRKFENTAKIEFLQPVPDEVRQNFARDFNGVHNTAVNKDISLPITVLYFKAGSINSRKAMISPFLPRLI